MWYIKVLPSLNKWLTQYIVQHHVTRKSQTEMRYQHIPSKMATIQNTDKSKCWWRCGITGTCICCWPTTKTKTIGLFLQNTYFCYTMYKCSWVFTPKVEKHVHIRICTWIFIASLLIITKIWKKNQKVFNK